MDELIVYPFSTKINSSLPQPPGGDASVGRACFFQKKRYNTHIFFRVGGLVRLFSPAIVKNDTFALDIGSSSVKVLQLARQGANWIIVGAGHSPINRSVVADKSIVDAEALGVAIDAALKNAGIRSRTAITSMPAAQTTSKVVTMPKGLNELEQENYMILEAPNHIPFSMDEVRMDFEILGENENDPNTYDVLLVATKLEHFQARVDACMAAGIEVEVMDMDELAIERAMRYVVHKNPLPSSTIDPIEVLVDIGHEFTVLHVLKNGRSIYSREQNFGMKQLTDEVSRRFGLSNADAQLAMAQGEKSNLPAEYVSEVLPQFRMEVANQINRLIQFFFAATSYNRVNRIWISGGGGGLSDVAKEVTDVTGVKTSVINPLAFADVAASQVPASYIHTMGSSFLTSFGLAIRED